MMTIGECGRTTFKVCGAGGVGHGGTRAGARMRGSEAGPWLESLKIASISVAQVTELNRVLLQVPSRHGEGYAYVFYAHSVHSMPYVALRSPGYG